MAVDEESTFWLDKGFYFHAAQDPSVVVPDTVGVILERLGFAVAKNLGHNSLEDDERGIDVRTNVVGATIGRPLQRQTNFVLLGS